MYVEEEVTMGPGLTWIKSSILDNPIALLGVKKTWEILVVYSATPGLRSNPQIHFNKLKQHRFSQIENPELPKPNSTLESKN